MKRDQISETEEWDDDDALEGEEIFTRSSEEYKPNSAVPLGVHMALVDGFGLKEASVVPKATLMADLGLDSGKFVELGLLLERLYGMQITEENFRQLDLDGYAALASDTATVDAITLFLIGRHNRRFWRFEEKHGSAFTQYKAAYVT